MVSQGRAGRAGVGGHRWKLPLALGLSAADPGTQMRKYLPTNHIEMSTEDM